MMFAFFTALFLAAVALAMPFKRAAGGPFDTTMTFYSPAGGLGACGPAIADTDMVVALRKELFESFNTANPLNQNLNPLCGTQIVITSKDVVGAQPVTATIQDSCVGCQGDHGIDATPALCTAVTGQADCLQQGTFQVSWSFV